jgi:hypothetical protein
MELHVDRLDYGKVSDSEQAEHVDGTSIESDV